MLGGLTRLAPLSLSDWQAGSEAEGLLPLPDQLGKQPGSLHRQVRMMLGGQVWQYHSEDGSQSPHEIQLSED